MLGRDTHLKVPYRGWGGVAGLFSGQAGIGGVGCEALFGRAPGRVAIAPVPVTYCSVMPRILWEARLDAANCLAVLVFPVSRRGTIVLEPSRRSGSWGGGKDPNFPQFFFFEHSDDPPPKGFETGHHVREHGHRQRGRGPSCDRIPGISRRQTSDDRTLWPNLYALISEFLVCVLPILAPCSISRPRESLWSPPQCSLVYHMYR